MKDLLFSPKIGAQFLDSFRPPETPQGTYGVKELGFKTGQSYYMALNSKGKEHKIFSELIKKICEIDREQGRIGAGLDAFEAYYEGVKDDK